MDTQNVTILYKKTMKMSELFDMDFRLLSLISHLDFKLCFGEKSVEMVCTENNFDPDCFLFLVNLYTQRGILNVEKEFTNLPLEPFLIYLKRTHSYFLDYRLPNIQKQLVKVFEKSHESLQKIVLDFFHIYYNEVKEHMDYEDDIVFPYINALLIHKDNSNYCIEEFEERHNDIERKVSDLKQILIKYVDGPENKNLILSILMDLYMIQNELATHNYIEDELVVPRVRSLEKK